MITDVTFEQDSMKAQWNRAVCSARTITGVGVTISNVTVMTYTRNFNPKGMTQLSYDDATS